jgi:pyruvate dehydrogenase E2 component (dihydrolipoamide acetyltransferase)
VLRDADKKGIVAITQETGALAAKAREGKLGPADMSGGCFSISSLGGIGGTAFTPIVNWPEVAILGISRGVFEPVWNGTTFEPRQMLPLSLSYDHRLIDGADAIRFLRWVAEALENPFALTLRG